MRIRCPTCHETTHADGSTELSNIVCPLCGSKFSLVGDDTIDYDHAKSRSIGHFELIERLGTGSFGTVWMARDKELDRIVAVKIPRKGQLDSVETEQFIREARAAAQLNHPNLVAVHEVGRANGLLYIVSDYVEGLTLAEWRIGQQLTSRAAVELCTKLADALHHAHEVGVIHRDLKPTNIVLDGRGEPHIMDFGLARRETGDVTMTMEGKVLGTPAYMSPEQARGDAHRADRRSDVYSLGVIFYELLTGHIPFRGNLRMLLQQVINDDPPRPRKLNGAIPRDLEVVCLKCLEKDPRKRYVTAKDLAEDLRRFLVGQPVHARPITGPERAWRWCRRNPIVASLLALLVVVFASGFGAVLSQWQRANANLALARKNESAMLLQRDVAKENLRQARQAVDDYLVKVRENQLLQAPGLQPLRQELLEAALRYFEQFIAQDRDDPISRSELADAHARVAEIHLAIGSMSKALEAVQSAISILEGLIRDEPGNREHQTRLALRFRTRGHIEMRSGKLLAARDSMIAAVEIFERLHRDDPTDRIIQGDHLALSCVWLGVLLRENNLLDKANEYNRRATQLIQDLVDLNVASGDDWSILASSYHLAAANYETQGDFYAALGSIRNAIQTRLTLLEQKRELSTNRIQEETSFLAQNYHNQAKYQLALRDSTGALQSLEQAISIQRSVAQANSTVTEFQAALAEHLAERGGLLQSLGRQDSAMDSFSEAAALWGALVDKDTQVDSFQISLALCCVQLAEFGKTAEAVAMAEKIVHAAQTGTGMVAGARVFASCAIAAERETKSNPNLSGVANTYALRAVEQLKRAHQTGHFQNPEQLEAVRNDKCFLALENRADYLEWVQSLIIEPRLKKSASPGP